ncbi:hypothetical protein LCGC14_0909780, partial [marine sediment metagenome]
MAQKIISGNNTNALHDTTTEYSRIDGDGIWVSTENYLVFCYFAVAGTLKNFRVRLLNAAGDTIAPPTGKTFAFTVMKNAAVANLTATIGEGQSVAQDLANNIDIGANDRLTLRCVPTGGAGADRFATWSFEFTPDTDGESVY